MVDDWDSEDTAPEEGKGILPKSLHKALLTGVSAVLMTEEGIRNALSDIRLPKEAISYVIQQTEKSRRDLYQAVTGEIKGFLENVDVSSVVRKALLGMRVEVRADIRFVDETKAETSLQTRVVDRYDDTEPPDEKVDDEEPGRAPTAKKRRRGRSRS